MEILGCKFTDFSTVSGDFIRWENIFCEFIKEEEGMVGLYETGRGGATLF